MCVNFKGLMFLMNLSFRLSFFKKILLRLLYLIPSFLTFSGLDKGFYFPHQLGDWCHDKGKVLDETL
jgi:hypothetical protein